MTKDDLYRRINDMLLDEADEDNFISVVKSMISMMIGSGELNLSLSNLDVEISEHGIRLIGDLQIDSFKPTNESLKEMMRRYHELIGY